MGGLHTGARASLMGRPLPSTLATTTLTTCPVVKPNWVSTWMPNWRLKSRKLTHRVWREVFTLCVVTSTTVAFSGDAVLLISFLDSVGGEACWVLCKKCCYMSTVSWLE